MIAASSPTSSSGRSRFAALCGVLFYEALHHHYVILVLFFAAVFAALFYRHVLGRRAQARRRVRALRWRIQAPAPAGPGVRIPDRARVPVGPPGGAAPRRPRPARARLLAPRVPVARVTAYAVRLGRAQYGRRCLARMEDQILVLAPQRTGKSGLIADRILSHPGPVLATSTRPDLYKITAGRPVAARPDRTSLTRRASAPCRRRSAGTCWPRAGIWSWPAA